MDKNGFIASVRFGMGARPEEVSAVESSPVNWLADQLDHPQPLPESITSLPSSQTSLETLFKQTAEVKNGNASKEQEKAIKKDLRHGAIEEIGLRAWFAASTHTPFIERLVNFWSNHFSVSMLKGGPVAGIATAFEREAIRPHVTGNFTDMLLAVTRHPAMLLYLDNAQSIGPHSAAGERSGKGLNENLAREIMELHTLGVNGGYTQQDVTTFAKVLTGWSIAREQDQGPMLGGLFGRRQGGADSAPGTFAFFDKRHEPGAETIMGRTYRDAGESQAVAVLTDLAANPATARHLATKLARHFIADVPPQTAIDALADSFQRSGGNLKAVYQTLIGLPEPWTLSSFKIKSGYDLVISAARAIGNEMPLDWCLQSLRFLGAVPFTATSPAGFPDTAQDIAGPEAILRRVEWARSAAHRLTTNENYAAIVDRTIGPIMQPATAQHLSDTPNVQEALALLFATPEFQKR